MAIFEEEEHLRSRLLCIHVKQLDSCLEIATTDNEATLEVLKKLELPQTAIFGESTLKKTDDILEVIARNKFACQICV